MIVTPYYSPFSGSGTTGLRTRFTQPALDFGGEAS
jgi:hypothetical protein